MATEMLCLPSPLCWRGRLFSHITNLQNITINGSSSSSTTLRVRCSVAAETPTLSTERRSANFQPTIWSYEKLQALENNLAVETYKENAKLLEGEIKSIIENETNVVSLLELINSVQRLGIGYRFRNEIEKSLEKFEALGGLANDAIKSLHATALGFRLLRQHGFHVSQDVFDMFKDETGKFTESLGEDIEGILSLYEASYLAMEGEAVLDEAKAFAVSHLKGIREKSGNTELAKRIGHVLEHPLHHRIDRKEARWSIDEFRRNGGVHEVVLELAVLDFNVVQHVLQRDLADMSRWWSGLDLASKLTFSRDRLMESFFWSVGMSPDPQFGSSRKAITKVFQLVTTIDDVYDVYGTQEELVLFTDAVERWDLDVVKDLPDYMKLCFLALYNTENDMAYEILREQGEVAIPYLKKAWSDLCKAFFQEAKWVHNKAKPSFEEYLDNAWRSVSGACMLIHAYFMVGQSVTQPELDHLENYHELLRLPSVIFRLCNDLATSSAELERGETVNSISCYMNQAGVSEEEAREYIERVIDDTWKKINKHLVDKSTPFSEPFIETAINLARISHVQYQHGDAHGAPDVKAKGRVQSLIIDPVPMTKQ